MKIAPPNTQHAALAPMHACISGVQKVYKLSGARLAHRRICHMYLQVPGRTSTDSPLGPPDSALYNSFHHPTENLKYLRTLACTTDVCNNSLHAEASLKGSFLNMEADVDSGVAGGCLFTMDFLSPWAHLTMITF